MVVAEVVLVEIAAALLLSAILELAALTEPAKGSAEVAAEVTAFEFTLELALVDAGVADWSGVDMEGIAG